MRARKCWIWSRERSDGCVKDLSSDETYKATIIDFAMVEIKEGAFKRSRCSTVPEVR